MSAQVHIDRLALEAFCRRVFRGLSLSKEDAQIATDVLVTADRRGIPSHGVARLPQYVHGLEVGLIKPDAVPEVLHDQPSSIVIDAHAAMGAPVSAHTMARVIGKAKQAGSAFGCVRNSNHFGIAGYYAMMALESDMIGIAMTNTSVLGIPTFGRQPRFGTNPIAFAAPANEEPPFVLDMATTVVTKGKLEVYDRRGKELPAGWAVNENGQPGSNPAKILDNLQQGAGGGILPLGGWGELLGGHKGYGLSIMVDVLCGVLSGASFGPNVFDQPGSFARVAHFFGAFQIERFRDLEAFRQDMDRMLRDLRNTPPAEGEERVYYAGLKEFEHEARCAQEGVPISKQAYEQLVAVAKEHDVTPPSTR